MNSEEIAKIAGVSRSTVSRVINNYSNVPEETREKVMKVIREYNYEPNTSARVLAGKQTNTIGLFVVSVSDISSPKRIYQNNYFAPFVDAVIDEANAKDYYVLSHTIYKEEDYGKIEKTFAQKRIDGAIIIGTEDNIDLFSSLSGQGYPMAVIDYDLNRIKELEENSNMAVINTSDYEGTEAAVKHLISIGHKDIGIIAGRSNTYSGRRRLEAFLNTMKFYGLEVNKEFILKGEFIKSSTYNEVKRLVQGDKLPTAIFSCNDDMALVAMKVFEEYGIKIPDDISIIGFDDVPLASQIRPSLTTVRVPVYDLAASAVKSIISLVERKNADAAKNVLIKTELFIRESTAIPRK